MQALLPATEGTVLEPVCLSVLNLPWKRLSEEIAHRGWGMSTFGDIQNSSGQPAVADSV